MSQETGAVGDLGASLETVAGLAVERAASLAPWTTLRIGGPAELFVTVSTEDGLRELLRGVASAEVPLRFLGLGSNVLYPDAGLAGAVARLDGVFRELRVDGERVHAGGAVPLAKVARFSAERGLSGLEAFSGFPATVGGAVVMNAGCYGREIADVLVCATVVDRLGARREIDAAALEPGYRHTMLQDAGLVVTRASFALVEAPAELALRRIEQLNRRRRASLPSGVANAGSVFRNPPGDHAGRLIEAAGLKGRRIGDAQISPRHANVIVNLGAARARDVLELMLLARETVLREHGVELEPEVVLEGELREAWNRQAGAASPAGAG